MSLTRSKRIEALEARKPVTVLRIDAAAAAAALRWCIASFEAATAGKASLIPRYGPPREPTPAMVAVLKQLDGIAKRLAEERLR
jgi:hypothetical protein